MGDMKIKFFNGTEKLFVTLYQANLRNANLRNADLHGTDLRGADLRSADLYGADLNEADLYEANLCAANLRAANLREADLRRANLREADLRGADLRGADLRRANLYGAIFCDTDLNGAIILFRGLPVKINFTPVWPMDDLKPNQKRKNETDPQAIHSDDGRDHNSSRGIQR